MILKNEETNIQVAVINYIRIKYPLVLFTIAPSGMKLPIYVARMLKAMGYTAGTPDIMIFEPRIIIPQQGEAYVYRGLFLEMKRENGGIVSSLQESFLLKLEARGYVVVVCRGYKEAIEAIDKYMKLKIPDQVPPKHFDRGFK